jgi:hypothetical protein
VNGINFPPGRVLPPLPGRLRARTSSQAVAGALPPTPSACSSILQPSQLTGRRTSSASPTDPTYRPRWRCRSPRHHEWACVRAPRVVRMCGRVPPRRIRREHYGNGYGSRVWDEDRH